MTINDVAGESVYDVRDIFFVNFVVRILSGLRTLKEKKPKNFSEKPRFFPALVCLQIQPPRLNAVFQLGSYP